MRRFNSKLFMAGLFFGLCCLCFLISKSWAAFQVPAYESYVTDTANVLSTGTELKLFDLCDELKKKTKVQMAILTVPSLEGTPLEMASLEVARKWGVGDKTSNNGLLILLAVNDHKLRTEIGYGLEGIITDGTSGEIQDSFMLPYFKQGDYDTGLYEGANAYAVKIASANQVTLSGSHPVQVAKQAPESESRPGVSWFGVILFLIFFLPSLFFRRRRNSWLYGGPFIGGGFGGGGFSGGDGGFGGFGGGSFGGGGSSRDW